MVYDLLKAGANPNQATLDDNTSPVWIACEYGHTEIVATLACAGADVNSPRTVGSLSAPIYIAILNGHTDVVKSLATAGADIQKTTAQGISPLQFAQAKGQEEIGYILLDALLTRRFEQEKR